MGQNDALDHAGFPSIQDQDYPSSRSAAAARYIDILPMDDARSYASYLFGAQLLCTDRQKSAAIRVPELFQALQSVCRPR